MSANKKSQGPHLLKWVNFYHNMNKWRQAIICTNDGLVRWRISVEKHPFPEEYKTAPNTEVDIFVMCKLTWTISW